MDAGDPRLIVYTAHGCCLCDDARAQLDALGPELGLDVDWVHIDGVPELEARWREQIPAGVLAGRKVFKYRVDADLLRRRAAQLARPGPGARGRLGAGAVDAFARDGYLLPDLDVFSPERFAGLSAIFEEDRQRWGDEDLDTIHFRDERLLDFLLSDEVLDLVEPLIGPDIGLWSSHFICKAPRTGKATPWHEDTAYWEGRISSLEGLVTVWLALDRVDAGNGAMQVIPGSHHGDDRRRYVPVDMRENIFDSELDPETIDVDRAVTFELQPNRCSIHDGRIVHGAPPNTSDRRRAGYTMRYFPLTSRVVPERNEGHRVWLARGGDRAGNELEVAEA